MCMMTPYMFLTCIIPGLTNPKNKIDVYLQPLVDELKNLWDGVQTYDTAMRQNFVMKAVLMWIVNDFPTLGILSGWSAHGVLGCPVCMEKLKATHLKHGASHPSLTVNVDSCPGIMHFEETELHFRGEKL